MDVQNEISPSAGPAAERFVGTRVHLIGIGGCGMRALAGVLLARGAVVSGSDAAHSASLDRLTEGGATIAIGQRGVNIPDACDMVVYSAAIHSENPELVSARQRGLPVLRYSAMLGRLMAQRTGIAVSGTHGKSTTSAMVAYVLKAADTDPSYIIGASVDQLGGPSGVGAGKFFVAEACEFDRSFLDLSPVLAAVLNIEEDHLDCYRDLAAIVEAFRSFVALIPAEGVLVANGEDRNVQAATARAACDVQTFGQRPDCTWRGTNLSVDRGRVTMDVTFGGKDFCRLASPLPGLHSAYNSLAATALLHHAGLSPERIARLLPTFTGVRRRITLKGVSGGMTVLDDYAHHPTEIQATLRAIRECYQPARLICVFQPHQHSRTRFLLKDFAGAFGAADAVIVPDIYFVRDSDREKDHISAEDLVAQIRLHGGAAEYVKTLPEIECYLQSTLRSGDLLVTMGAGNIWEVADGIVRWLGIDRKV